MRRSERIEIRLTPEELAELDAKAAAANMTRSELLRDHLGRMRIAAREDKRAVLRQLARIGNNLNQVARWVNTYRTALDAVQVLRELRKIRRAVEELTGWQS